MCYPARPEPDTAQLERSTPLAGLASPAEGLAPAAHCRGSGVSAAAVSQWLKRARLGGPQALRRQPSPGASRRLASEQLARLPDLLHRGPEAYGFRSQVWTRERVAEVIRVAFGMRYHPTHVGRLLKVLRWSPQKPMRRARQRDEAAIPRWRTETWPALKKGRKRSSRPSSS